MTSGEQATAEGSDVDQSADADLARWLRDLTKVELHVHLEGSMSVDTVRSLSERHGFDLSSIWPNGLPEAFSFEDFPDFARQFFYGLSLLRTGDDLVTIIARALGLQSVPHAGETEGAHSFRPPYSTLAPLGSVTGCVAWRTGSLSE